MAEPNNPNQYDSRGQEAIDFYKHYKSIQIQDLVAEYVSRSARDDREVMAPIRQAMLDRMDEMEEFREGI